MSEITPEKVAHTLFLPDAFSGPMDARLSIRPEGCVLNITVEPNNGEVRHFRAPVVEGEKSPYVASLEFLAAARALFRWNAAASTLAAEQFAALVYEVDDALAALTPEQMAVLAGDDEQAGTGGAA
jgi:hypothetical protein